MSSQGWVEALTSGQGDGPTLTAAAAASAIPVYARITLPQCYFSIGKILRITAHGRISCAVTTPGTARWDVRLGGTAVFDTAALNLNVVAKTTVPWWLEILLTCRAVGNVALTTFMGCAQFQSEAVVGSPLPSAGGNGTLLAPVGAPAVGTGVDGTSALTFDTFFTQTVASGSMTMHQYLVQSLN